MTGPVEDLTTSQTEDGSTIYNGKVPAGALARETGLKEGETLRVLPFGNVAHDDAANPASLIDISISVRPDGTIGEIHATWGGGSSWITVSPTAISARRRRWRSLRRFNPAFAAR